MADVEGAHDGANIVDVVEGQAEMAEPELTIVICTWNRCELLLETLQSLDAQIVPESWDVEVVVVDNNSRDETFTQVQSVAKRWRLGQLRVVREQRQGKQFALIAPSRSQPEIFFERSPTTT